MPSVSIVTSEAVLNCKNDSSIFNAEEACRTSYSTVVSNTILLSLLLVVVSSASSVVVAFLLVAPKRTELRSVFSCVPIDTYAPSTYTLY